MKKAKKAKKGKPSQDFSPPYCIVQTIKECNDWSIAGPDGTLLEFMRNSDREYAKEAVFELNRAYLLGMKDNA